MDKNRCEEIESEALFNSVDIAFGELLEAVADLAETPGFKREMLTPITPLLRTWNMQIEAVIRGFEKTRMRLIADECEIGPDVSGQDVELDGRF